MKTEMYLHESEAASLTLVLTMEVGEWRTLRDQIGHAMEPDGSTSDPASSLHDRIGSMLSKVDSTFVVE